MRDRLAVLDRALIAGRQDAPVPPPAPPAAAREPAAAAPHLAAPRPKVRREPLRLGHRVERGLTALWWFLADGALLGLAALLKGMRPLRTMTVGAPVSCVAVGLAISLWWGAWAYAVIGVLAAVSFVWIGRSEQS